MLRGKGRSGAVLDPEFAEDIFRMPFDRAFGDLQPFADLNVRSARYNEFQHFQFAAAELFHQPDMPIGRIIPVCGIQAGFRKPE